MTWIDKSDPSKTATTDENPRKTKSIHVWFYRLGKVWNHCIVPSAWFLSRYHLEG